MARSLAPVSASILSFGRAGHRAPGRSAPVLAALCAVPGNPVPARPRLAVLDAGGACLRTAAWLPAGAARGTVLLLQGRGDFIEKYLEVVADLLARGFAVATFDWRGQGGSQRLHKDPHRGHAERFTDYDRDLNAVIDHLLRGLPRPWIGLAHSMGAAVLLPAMAARPDLFACGALTAPMVALSRRLEPAGARIVTRVLATAGLAGLSIPGPRRRGLAHPVFQPDNLLTSDPVRYLRSYDILSAAPGLGVGKPTIGWLRAAYDGMTRLHDARLVAAMRTPVLVVAGDRDQVTDTPAAMALAARWPGAVTRSIKGAAHDVLMERDVLRDQFWAAFDGFSAPFLDRLTASSRPVQGHAG